MSKCINVRFPQESPSAFKRGGCPLSSIIRVRIQQELLSVLLKNMHKQVFGLGGIK
jgi:hypothetical protein